MTKPRVDTEGFEVSETEDGLRVVRSATGAEILLHPVATRVFRLADGTRSITQIHEAVRAEDTDATKETVFRSLDALADVGLLRSRVSPPGGVARIGRRDLLKGAAAAGITVAVAGAGTFGAPRTAHARDAAAQEERRKLKSEENAKRSKLKAEEKAKRTKLKAEETAKRSERKSETRAKKDKAKGVRAEEKAKLKKRKAESKAKAKAKRAEEKAKRAATR